MLFPPQGSATGGSSDESSGGGVDADQAFDSVILDITNEDVLLNRQAAGVLGVGTTAGARDGELRLGTVNLQSALEFDDGAGTVNGRIFRAGSGRLVVDQGTANMNLSDAFEIYGGLEIFNGSQHLISINRSASGDITVGSGGKIGFSASGVNADTADAAFVRVEANAIGLASGDELQVTATSINFTGTTASDTTTPTLIALPTGATAAQAVWITVEVNGTTTYIPGWQ